MSLNSEKSCEKERDSKRKKQDKLEKVPNLLVC